VILYVYTFTVGFITGVGVGAFQWAIFTITKAAEARHE